MPKPNKPIPEDPSIDKFAEVARILAVLVIIYEVRYNFPNKAAEILHEFDNMAQARTVVVGSPDPTPKMARDYLDYHYAGPDAGHPKPEWYEALSS